MRLTDVEKEPFFKMREVSELRIQFQCEFRLNLRQKFGDSHSPASVAGTELHRQVSIQSDRQDAEKIERRLVPLFIIVVTLIVGIMWIMW
jgi:hypothetical protein